MSAIQRGSVVHHFHPELFLQSSQKLPMDKSEQGQASSSVSPTTTNLSLYQ